MRYSATWLLLIGIPLLQAPQNTGIKMTIRRVIFGTPSDQTIYLQRDRKRMEYRNSSGHKRADGSLQEIYGPQLVSITRCDLGQMFDLNLDAAEYESAPYPPKPITKEQMEARGLKMPQMSLPEKPTLRIETTTVDTSERKEIFGRMARHVVATRKEIPLQGSLSELQETVTDGWYIDFDQRISCDPRWPEGTKAHLVAGVWNAAGQPAERYEFVDIGKPETGFALQQVTITKVVLADGSEKQTNSKFE
jgi:hypothetical protein